MNKGLLFLLLVFSCSPAFSQGQVQYPPANPNTAVERENFFTEEENAEEERNNQFSEESMRTSQPGWNTYQHSRLHLSASAHQLQGSWIPLGPSSFDSTTSPAICGVGVVWCVAVAPSDSNTVYVCSTGGVWKSIDGGDTWIPKTDFIRVIAYWITVDPTNANIVYLASNNGLLKSVDGGDSWTKLPIDDYLNFGGSGKTLINTDDPQKIYFAHWMGLYKSTDGGNSWIKLSPPGFRDVKFRPGNPTVLYGIHENYLFRSYDEGLTFDSVFLSINDAPYELAVTPQDTNSIYLLYHFQIQLSTNGGNTFSTLSNNYTCYMQGSNVHSFAVSPSNRNSLVVGCIGLNLSNDAGVTWHFTTAPIHYDFRFISYFGNTLWVGSDGGVFKSYDNGATFIDKSAGLNIEQLENIGSSSSDTSVFMCSGWHNGSIIHSNGSWKYVAGGDGFEVMVDPSNSQILYMRDQHNIMRSMDGGLTRTFIMNGLTESPWGYFQIPFIMNPQNPATIYIFLKNVWKSDDRGDHWYKISNFYPGTSGSLVVAPSDTNYIYAGKYRTSDGGITWDSIPNPPQYMTVNENNPLQVWGAHNSSTLRGLNYSSDGGTTWQQITTDNLPNTKLTCAIIHEDNGRDGLYIATGAGVFYKDTTLNVWQPFNSGLPYVVVKELEIINSANILRAATQGRGVWQSSLFIPDQAPAANFIADKFRICAGDSIRFFDWSLNNGPGYSPVYQWSFPGGTPSTSTDANPVITYNTAGTFNAGLRITNINGGDSLTVNSYITVISSIPIPPPIHEGFDTTVFPPPDWISLNVDSGSSTWLSLCNTTNIPLGSYGYTPGCATISGVLSHTSGIATGKHYVLLSPHYDLSSTVNPVLSFDYAHFYLYHPDTLNVFYTTDCGTTKNYFLQKVNADLITGSYGFTAIVIPDSNQWRTCHVLLPSAAAISDVQFGFEFNPFETLYSTNLWLDEINIRHADPPTGNFSSNSRIICSGDTVRFTDRTIFNGPMFSPTYQWSFPGGNPASSTDANPVIVYDTAGVYDVQMILTNIFGADSITINNYITVRQSPAPFPIIQSYDSLFAPQGYSVYRWHLKSLSGADYGLQSINYYCLISLYNGRYEVTVTDSNSCSTTVVDTGYTIPPLALFSASDTNICENSYVIFTDLSLFEDHANPFFTPNWYFPGGNPATSNSPNPWVHYSYPGNYDVTLAVMGLNSGGVDTLALHNFIHVFPDPLMFTLTVIGDSLLAPQGFTSYQWYNYPNTIVGATNYYYKFTQNGSYFCHVIDTNGCDTYSYTVHILNVGTGDLNASESGIGIFPNPAPGSFTITFNSQENKSTKIELLNTLSQTVFARELTTVAGENKVEIENQNLVQGIYFLKISTEAKTVMSKVVIEK